MCIIIKWLKALSRKYQTPLSYRPITIYSREEREGERMKIINFHDPR